MTRLERFHLARASLLLMDQWYVGHDDLLKADWADRNGKCTCGPECPVPLSELLHDLERSVREIKEARRGNKT